MTTIRMRKGDLYADIFDSPETIKEAQRNGYSIVEKHFDEPKEEESKAETSEKKTKRQ